MLQREKQQQTEKKRHIFNDREFAGLPFRTALAEDPVPPQLLEVIRCPTSGFRV